jgi:hypothetical protein
MIAAREQMRLSLKEIYNYNSYDFDGTSAPENHAAPYSHAQHKAFLHKFAYYLKDNLAAMDAAIEGMTESAYARVVTRTEEASDEM